MNTDGVGLVFAAPPCLAALGTCQRSVKALQHFINNKGLAKEHTLLEEVPF